MTTNLSSKELARNAGRILISCVLLANAHAAPTALSTEPLILSTAVNALPNVMFVLDDSGSMKSDFLPDWAGPYKATISGVPTVITPAHRFFNGAYNGVAYNPSIRYRPPKMFTDTGVLDTTSYPSQTGLTAAEGADGSAKPNWKAVKVDGYGIQSAATASLEGNSFFYTTVAGEYCDSVQLKNCIASATPSGAYTFPAKLRWCTTSLKAVDTTANAGTACQASNIADTPANTTNGVTIYTFPRMPRPHTATLTVGAAGTVTGITVDGLQILSAASVTGGTSTDLATAIAASINACTLVKTGIVCQVVGYSAVSLADVVTITAPVATSSTPVVTGGTTTPGAFSNGNVPGSSVFTVITPSVASYVKGVNRTDCTGATCTYAEEMTNYANWYSYYSTRMQSMKTAASIAFAEVSDKFRVGYYSINNGAGSEFLNVSAFDDVQRNLWYTKFLGAVPFGATPLRGGLATIGRMYAGKLSTLNSVAVTEPMQYSCQQNFTILSTDGYWNDASNPVQIDGSTEIGQQDGSLDRPYYDGGKQTKTVTRTLQSFQQQGKYEYTVENYTRQLQTSTSRLAQELTTTTRQPWEIQTSHLQTQTRPLKKSTYNLESRTYPLLATTNLLRENTFKPQSTTRPLERYTFNLTKTITPLQKTVTNITVKTFPLEVGTETVTSTTSRLQVGTETVKSTTAPLQVGTETVKSTTAPLQVGTETVTSTTSPLQSSTYKLRSTKFQLQKRSDKSTDGGDTYFDTGWVDVTSGNCTTYVGAKPDPERNVQCRYRADGFDSGLASCTQIPQTAASPYTVRSASYCTYEAIPVVAPVGSCNVVAQSGTSPYSEAVSCGYGTAGSAVTVASCSARDQTAAASMSGDKVVCGYNTKSWDNATGSPVTCTPNAPANFGGSRITCRYGSDAAAQTVASCTGNNQALTSPMTGNRVVCGYNTISWDNATGSPVTCTPNAPANFGGSRITCRYNPTAEAVQTVASCSAWDQGASPTSQNKVVCGYNTVSWLAAGTCTPAAPANYGGSRITCRYNPTASSTNTGQTSCAPNSQATTGAMTGNKVECTYDATSTTTTTTPCTWNDSATAVTPRVTCAYTGPPTTSTVTAPDTCVPVAGDTGTANGTEWDGSVTTCTWNTALVATGLTSCSPTGSAAGPPFTPYTTCGYGAGVVATGLSSCTEDLPESGPSYTGGSTTACAYPGTATTISAPKASCLWVAPSATFAAPATTCTYDADVTTTVTDCTDQAKSTGGSGTYNGPAVSCAYQATASVTDPNAPSCTPRRQLGSPYSGGAAIDCAYNATAAVTDVTTCSNRDQSPAGPYTGAKIVCNDTGGFGAWTNVASGNCDVAGQSGPTDYIQWRNCQYTDPTAEKTYGNTCTNVPASPGPVTYTVRTPVLCVPGSFTTSTVTNTTTVDSCNTTPTQTGDTALGTTQVNTATTCTYAATPTVAPDTSCTPSGAAGSPVSTTIVTCTSTPGAWTAMDGSCSPVGTQPPASTPAATIPAEFVGGLNVGCRTNDVTGTPTAFVQTPSCLVSTAAALQRQCSLLVDSTPTPVQPAPANPTPCVQTSGDPPGPDFIKTICSTTSTASTVAGCGPQTATSPFWETVTCDNIAGSGSLNSLADVAAYYYYTDLRTTALGNCTGAVVPPEVTGSVLCTAADAMNNVPTTTKDPLSTQHMTTFTLGLGASGYMKFSDTYLTDTSGDYSTVYGIFPHAPINGIAADPANGVCSWQATGSGNCNWPVPAADEQTTIDDLWHAGVNGHGAYFSPSNPEELGKSITKALESVTAGGGFVAAPGLGSAVIAPGENYLFSSSYLTSEWSGDLVRKQVYPYPLAVATDADWKAQGRLDGKSAASRNIWTFKASVATTKLIAFTSANFAANVNFLSPHIDGLTQFACVSPETCLSATDQDSSHAAGANLVDFLRGDRSHEGDLKDNAKYYRQRQHVLGDMVNAEAVFVSKPRFSYADPGYGDFVIAQASRQGVVYAGANDGMLHAFAAKGSTATEDAITASTEASTLAFLNPSTANTTAAAAAKLAAETAIAADTVMGNELWAYIPSMVIPNLYALADKKYKEQHRYYVDATPVVSDVCVSPCAAASDWRTILVGGLGGGGRGYYALDITVPTSPKALWEFTDDDLGYTYGGPQVAKLSNGTWAVMLTSGYNNIPNADGTTGDGVGRLYVLDAITGAQLASPTGESPISTGVGNSTSPSGLGQIVAQVNNPKTDNTVDAVYGGDLLGNLWRFDVNGSIGASGYDAQLLAVLKDGDGVRQSISTKPEVAKLPGGQGIMVYVGTGRFLDRADAATTSDASKQQSVYGIKDPRSAGSVPATAIYDNPGGVPRAAVRNATTGFIHQIHSLIDCPAGTPVYICGPGEKVFSTTNNPVNYASDNGWFVDLIKVSDTYQRVNTDPTLAQAALVFNTNSPSSSLCENGKSYQYWLDYLTGGAITSSENSVLVGKFLFNSLVSKPQFLVVNGVKYLITQTVEGKYIITQPPPTKESMVLRRTSWRELIQE